ncbi:MAG: TetR/AcrR family transcriptional regulator [Solirubrobacteraceae bacterium]
MIEAAALPIFATHGYPDARLEDIAAAAEVTKQLLYRYFPSKKGLFLAVLARQQHELLGQLAGDLSAEAPPGPRIEHALDRWLAFIQTRPLAASVLFRDTTGDPEIHAAYRRMQAEARGAIAASIARTDPPVDGELIDALAEIVRAGSVGAALWWIEHPEVPRAAMLELILAVFQPGRRGAD